jgi:sterol 3beta-glucosyltransferase
VGLRRAGHEVTLVAPTLFRPRIEAAGCAFRPFGPPVDEPFVKDLMGRSIAIRDPIAQLDLLYGEGVCRGADEVWETTRDVVGASDLVVAHVTGAPAFAAAELLGRPLVTGTYHDGLVPSAHHAFPGFPSLGRVLNPLAWRFGSWLVSRSLDRWFNLYRARAGLAPAHGFFWGRVFGGAAVLVGASPAACGGRRPDWPADVHLTGEWVLDDPPGEPSPELSRFVEAGEPPVLVSIGSVTVPDPVGFTRAVVEAARATGTRVILQEGWAGLGRGVDLPPEVFGAGWLPHGWLLPRCAAIVHHAGQGTTNAGWRAGIPAVALPQAFDQPFWADRIRRLGAGVSLALGRVNARRLAAKLVAVKDAGMRARTRALADRIRQEDGVARAVEVIERIAKG